MVLECVRIKHVPNAVSERDLEDDWGDLNISENGIYFLQDKLYVFFNDKRDAEDAQNRGLSFNKKILKAKQLSIDDCITEMRPLVQDEKRQAIKYGEKYEYPVIFEKHKIRIKWEDSKIVQHTPPTPLKEAKPVNRDEHEDESDYTDEDGTVPEADPKDNGEKTKSKKDKKTKKEKKKKKDKDKDKEKKSKKKKKHKDKSDSRERGYSRENSRDRYSERRRSSRDYDDERDSRGRSSRYEPDDRYDSRDGRRDSRDRGYDDRGYDDRGYDDRPSDNRRDSSRDQRSEKSRDRRDSYSRSRNSRDRISYDRDSRDRNSRSRLDSGRGSSRDRKRKLSNANDQSGDYNPLAMLGGQLKKDGANEGGGKKSRWSDDKGPSVNDQRDKPTDKSNGGGGIDLRAKLSRTNRRAEEKQKRIDQAKEQIAKQKELRERQQQERFGNRGRGRDGRGGRGGRGRNKGGRGGHGGQGGYNQGNQGGWGNDQMGWNNGGMMNQGGPMGMNPQMGGMGGMNPMAMMMQMQQMMASFMQQNQNNQPQPFDTTQMANQLPFNQSQPDQPQNNQSEAQIEMQPNQQENVGDIQATNEQATEQSTNDPLTEQPIENDKSEEGSKIQDNQSQESAEENSQKADAATEETSENSTDNKSNEQTGNDIETKPSEPSEETTEDKTTDSSEAQPENKPEAQPEAQPVAQPEAQLKSEDMQIEEESKPVPSADIGLSLDDLIAKKKSETKSQSNEMNPMEMMQKMMAMMSGQIPMDPSILNFDPTQLGNVDPAMMANMTGMMQNFMMGQNNMGGPMGGGNMGGHMGPMMGGPMGGQGGYDQGWGAYDQGMMNQGPSMEEQIAAAKPMLKNIDQTTKKFIDTHCHIDTMYKKEGFNGDWDTYRQNVAIEFPDSYDGCIASFCDPKLFQKKFAFNVLDHDKVWACFGCHPHHAHLYNADVEAQLEVLAKHPKTVAWGAIGLDYSDKYGRTDHDLQKAVFRRQCELAVKHNLPIVIQCRKAERDLMMIMKEIVPKDHKIHRHCLNDKMAAVREAFEYFPNMYFGFTNVITNQNAVGPRSAVADCPLDRILIETDAPHFVPRTLRSDVFGGTTPVSMSHPGMALCVAVEIAQFQMRSLDEVIEVTRENAKKLYGI